MVKGRILSGMRPTGKFHLGNYMGALENWVRLQDDYECFYCIVDLHALTTAFDDTSEIKDNIREMAIDWLSAGLDPEKSTIFVQSHVKQHAELHLLLSMITPVSWLERCPTYKDQIHQLGLQGKDIATYGFLGYPLLQTADIIIYKADTVPVGEDQIPHIELAREIARRFNYLFGPVFPEPQVKLTKAAVLPGIDGRKMSKSYGNTIPMAATPEEIREKVQAMITDPQRIKRTDPGHPEVCVVHNFQRVFNPEQVENITKQCREAEIGCVGCKKIIAEILIERLGPIYQKRKELEGNPRYIDEVLEHGAKRAREVAEKTMEEVRRAMRI